MGMTNGFMLGEVEVSATGIPSLMDAFRDFTLLASQIMVAEGIGEENADGAIKFKPDDWYPVQRYLSALERVRQQVGDQVLFEGGLAVPKHAVFPPMVKGLHDALGSIDIAYHMNHRRNGQVMFDPASGQMIEGMGHYRYEVVDTRRGVMQCEEPYPCDYDRGIITTIAKRFEPSATVVHDGGRPCRKKGGSSCTFNVTWR
jgi:hypothetical protein